MEDSQHVAEQLKKAFGHTHVYAILEIDKSASASEIKKAYMKLALRYHPDKGGSSEMFQALSVAHAIISDSEKRKIYDESGIVDDFDAELDQNFAFWYDYFRQLTPKVTVDSIQKYEEAYIGSEEEKDDIVNAFKEYKGDLTRIMNAVMFAEDGAEARICKVIDQALADGIIKKNKLYTTMRDKAIKKAPKKTKKRAAENDDLALQMAKRSSDRAGALAGLMSKYSEGMEDVDADEYNIPDEEFERMQASLLKKSKKK